jgi:hypothetical protein
MDGDLPLVTETPGGLSLKYHDAWLYSSRDPRALPEKSALSFFPPERSLVIVFSPLLGYGLDILLSRLPPGSSLLCLEAEESLYRLALERIPESLRNDPRFYLAYAQSAADLSGFLPRLGAFRRALALSLSGGYRLHQKTYDGIFSCLEREIGLCWRNRATLAKLGRLWVRNLISNLSCLPRTKSMEDLDDAVADRAVLVAGAGPSLERAYAWLARWREAVFILAVDTALPALRAAGIRPDAVLCLEGQVHNLGDFIGSSDSRIPLIADLSSHPVSFRGLGGPVYPIASRFADCALLARLELRGILPYSLPPLGSVGVAALSLALRRWGGRNPILVSGLDFAFPKGKVHARGAPSHSAYLRSRARLSSDGLFTAAFRSGTRPIDARVSMYSDPVLSGYADIARAELSEFPASVFDARGFGIDLGLEAFSLESGLPPPEPLSQLAQARNGRAAAVKSGEASCFSDDGQLSAFALDELGRVRELRALLSGDAAMDSGRLETLLAECDYLCLHFPDRPEKPLTDKSYLRRLSVEADSAIARWAALAARLSQARIE